MPAWARAILDAAKSKRQNIWALRWTLGILERCVFQVKALIAAEEQRLEELRAQDVTIQKPDLTLSPEPRATKPCKRQRRS